MGKRMSLIDRFDQLTDQLDPLIQLEFPDWRLLEAPTPRLRPLPKNGMPESRRVKGGARGRWEGTFDCDGRYLLWTTTTSRGWVDKGNLVYSVLASFATALVVAVVLLFASQRMGALIALLVAAGLMGVALFVRFCLPPAVEKVAIFDRQTGLVYLPLPHRCGPMVCHFDDLKAYYVATPTMALYYAGGLEIIPEVLPPGAPDRGFRVGMDSHATGYGASTGSQWWGIVHEFMTSPEEAPWANDLEWARRVEAYRRLNLTIPELYPPGLTQPFILGVAFDAENWCEHVEAHFARTGRPLPPDWPVGYVDPKGLLPGHPAAAPVKPSS